MKNSKHLLDIQSLDIKLVEHIFAKAQQYLDTPSLFDNVLEGRVIVNLFFENSTRTQSSFEIASKRGKAQVVNFDATKSSTSKGEILYDVALNINAMNPDAVVLRHSKSGMPKILSKYLNCPIINGGDGSYAHPSQALLDLFTIKKYFPSLEGVKIAIMGDIKNSRVANSNIELLDMFGIKPILISPPHFTKFTNLQTTYHLKDVIDDVNILIVLRTQVERHSQKLYASLDDYGSRYCVNSNILKDKDIILLHPGPVNRNIDISDEVLLDDRCKVLEQVKHGIAIREAILEYFIKG
jgi:aspartate carbamoyltransferase catalytic subunit